MSDENECGAVGPMGFSCTRPVGHKGDHCADEIAINVTFDRWKNNHQGDSK